MKRLVVFLALLIAQWASAQVIVAGGGSAGPFTPCGTPAPPHTVWRQVEWKPFSCAPDISRSFLRTNPAGMVAWGTCSAGGKDYKWQAAVTTARLNEIPAIASDVAKAIVSSTPIADLNAAQAKYSDTDWVDPKLAAVWCPYEAEIAAFLTPPAPPAPPAPPGTWRVAKYSVQVSRPSFTVVGGGLGPVSSTRAPVGTACDSAAPPLVVGGATYYPWAGSSGLVTVCVKQ